MHLDDLGVRSPRSEIALDPERVPPVHDCETEDIMKLGRGERLLTRAEKNWYLGSERISLEFVVPQNSCVARCIHD